MPLLRRVLWSGVAVLAALLLQPLYVQPLGWGPGALVIAFCVFAALRPFEALLILAALAPIATSLYLLLRTGSIGIRFGEALTLAYLVGWAARRAVLPQPLRVPGALRWSAAALAVLAVASIAIEGVVMVVEQPASTGAEIFRQFLSRDYLFSGAPLTKAFLFIECVLLLLAVADACALDRRRRDSLLEMMVVGASASAIVNVFRLVTAAMSREHAWSTFLDYMMKVRVDLNIVDLNAAGSYFAMILFVALGFMRRGRPAAWVGVLMAATGLWVAGSRVALASVAVCGAIAGMTLLVARPRKGPVIAAIVLAGLAVVAAWKWYPPGRNVNANYAFAFRVEMGRAALKHAATHPVFGIGLGRFYPLSVQYASIRENAHNNFLQVLAELGTAGLLMFVIVIGVAIGHELRRPRPPGPSWTLALGLGAFLLTCMAGHPLLVPGAAYAFWMALGVAAAPEAIEPPAGRPVKTIAVAVFLLAAVSLPFRAVAAVREADVENATVGFASLWQHDPTGVRYRWAGGRAVFFVPSTARAIRIPLRLPQNGPTEAEVRITLDGRDADRVLLHGGEDWRTVLLTPARRSPSQFSRVELDVRLPGAQAAMEIAPTPTTGAVMVGRPVVEP